MSAHDQEMSDTAGKNFQFQKYHKTLNTFIFERVQRICHKRGCFCQTLGKALRCNFRNLKKLKTKLIFVRAPCTCLVGPTMLVG